MLAILAGGAQTYAQAPSEPPAEVRYLSIGPWTGVAQAAGQATTSGDGVDFLYNGTIQANLEIVVLDESIIEGQWTHNGTANNLVTGNIGGQDAQIDMDLEFSGAGTIGGSPEILRLDGTSRSTGSATISATEGSYTASIDNQSDVPTLPVEIQHAQCHEAYGDWIWALEQEFENQGFRTELGGSFMAVRDQTEIQEQLYQIANAIFEGQPPVESRSPLFNMIGEHISRVNDFIGQYPDWSMGDVMDALAWSEFFINQLRNLRPCDEKFFGEDAVEYFVTGLTFQVQQLVMGGANLDSVDGNDVFQLMEVATRAGALGPGAPNPFEAVRAEEQLRKAAQRILESNLDPEDNRIIANEDSVKAMLTGAIMDWTFFVGGVEYNARATYETIGRSWQEDSGGGS